MYERFTNRARKIMELANQEAQRLNHEYLGTEHQLLGLIKHDKVKDNLAVTVLENLGIDLDKIRSEVIRLVQSGPDMVTLGKLPQTPRAKKVIEYALEESRNLNHNYIGLEHLLLGLLRETEGVASQVLMDLGLKLGEARKEVQRLLGEETGPKQSKATETPQRFLVAIPETETFGFATEETLKDIVLIVRDKHRSKGGNPNLLPEITELGRRRAYELKTIVELKN